ARRTSQTVPHTPPPLRPACVPPALQTAHGYSCPADTPAASHSTAPAAAHAPPHPTLQCARPASTVPAPAPAPPPSAPVACTGTTSAQAAVAPPAGSAQNHSPGHPPTARTDSWSAPGP